MEVVLELCRLFQPVHITTYRVRTSISQVGSGKANSLHKVTVEQRITTQTSSNPKLGYHRSISYNRTLGMVYTLVDPRANRNSIHNNSYGKMLDTDG